MDDPQNPYKQRLLDALTRSDKTNSGLEELSQTLVDSTRLQLDLNTKVRGAIEKMTDASLPSAFWEHMTDGIVAQNAGADMAARQISELAFVTTSGTSANASTASSVSAAYIFRAGGTPLTVQPGDPATAFVGFPEVVALQRAVQSIFDGRDSVAELVDLVKRLGIDVTHPGSRSPLDHLQSAALTLRRPAGPTTSPTAVFMDFREGVDRLLERLIRKTGRQKSLKNAAEKIAFIGEHLGSLVLGPAHFQRLGASFLPLREDFTEAKGLSMSREQVLAKFNEAMFILVQILKDLDPARLR